MLYPEKIGRCQTFEELIDTSVIIFKESNPVLSTLIGITQYNNLWPDNSIHGVRQDIRTLEAIQEKLSELSSKTAEEDELLLLEWFITLNLHELKEIEMWKSAFTLSELVLSGIDSLIRKSHPDQFSRIQSIIARLRSIAPLIKNEQRRVINPVQLWLEAEKKSIRSLIRYIQNLLEVFKESDETISDLTQAVNYAVEQLNEHLTWLRDQKGGDLPVDTTSYEELLNLRQVGFNPKELEELGYRYLKWTNEQLLQLTERFDADSVDQLRKKIRADHAPDFDVVIENYRNLADNAKRFIKEKELLTIPEEQLKVIKTPEPMRHLLSIAAAGTAGKYDPDQTGYFFCTTHDDPEMLKEHSYAYQPLLITHESYPGHHIHAVCKNQHLSLVRSKLFAHPSANSGLMYSSKLAEITEGWGLYCEEMMWKAGFASNGKPDLKQRFLQINALRWRAVRAIIDTNLHTGQMSFEEAVQFLIEKTGFHRTIAEAEVLMYSRSPGYFSSYLLGKHLITELKKKLGETYDLKKFHNTILYAGNVPWWFIQREFLPNGIIS